MASKEMPSELQPGLLSLKGKNPLLSQPFFDDDNGLVDVTFVVEEKPINFCKAFLMVSSPVFDRMFSSDFKEKEEQPIPLPGKTYSDFVVFLKQFHPAFSWATLKADGLEPLLKLSDEYDVTHIREKCLEFIRNQMEMELTDGQVLMYLRLSDAYKITAVRDQLIALAADHPIEKLEKLPDFNPLEDFTKFELAKKRCQLLQEIQARVSSFVPASFSSATKAASKLHKTAQAIRKLKLLASRLPGLIDGLPPGTMCIRHNNTPSGSDSEESEGECVDQSVLRFGRAQLSSETHLSRYCTECVARKTEFVVAYFYSLLGLPKDSSQRTCIITFNG